MATTDVHVNTIAAAMAEAEEAARDIRVKIRSLRDDFDTIHANGDAGYLATKKFFTRLDVLVTTFEHELYEAHSDMTEYAQARGIDLPSVEGGGGR